MWIYPWHFPLVLKVFTVFISHGPQVFFTCKMRMLWSSKFFLMLIFWARFGLGWPLLDEKLPMSRYYLTHFGMLYISEPQFRYVGLNLIDLFWSYSHSLEQPSCLSPSTFFFQQILNPMKEIKEIWFFFFQD